HASINLNQARQHWDIGTVPRVSQRPTHRSAAGLRAQHCTDLAWLDLANLALKYRFERRFWRWCWRWCWCWCWCWCWRRSARRFVVFRLLVVFRRLVVCFGFNRDLDAERDLALYFIIYRDRDICRNVYWKLAVIQEIDPIQDLANVRRRLLFNEW